MNKHLQTLVGFKKGTKNIFSELRYDLLDSFVSLKDAFTGFAKALFVLVVWILVLLVMLFALPVATLFRLKWEREQEEAYNKAKQKMTERMACLHQEQGDPL